MWIMSGLRLGIEGVKEKLGFDMAVNGKEFLNSGIDFSKFDEVFFHNFKDDYRDSSQNKYDLYDLVKSFKAQVGFTKDETPEITKQVYSAIKVTEIENSANVAQQIGIAMTQYTELKDDKNIVAYVNATTNNLRKEVKDRILKIEAEPKTNNYNTEILSNRNDESHA